MSISVSLCLGGEFALCLCVSVAFVMNSVVIHYKELALKGRNRPWFVNLLVKNLRAALKDLGVRNVRSVMGRIEIDLDAGTPVDRIEDRLRRVFGIANFSHAGRAPHAPDAL